MTIADSPPPPALTLPALLEATRALGDSGHLPVSDVAPTQSDLTHALAWQLAQRPSVGSVAQALALLAPPVVSGLAPIDIGSLLHGTVEAARARGKALGHARPSNAVRRVARILEHLAPWAVNPPRLDADPNDHGTVFHELAALVFAGVERAEAKEARRRRQVAWNLRTLGRHAAVHGATRLADIPAEYTALCKTLVQWGIAPKKCHQAVSDLRAAQRFLSEMPGAPRLPTWPAPSRGKHLDALLVARLPRLAEDLELWERLWPIRVGDRDPNGRDRSSHHPLRRTTADRMRSAVKQWAEALVTAVDSGALACPVPLDHVDLESLFTELVIRNVPLSADDSDPFVARRARRLGAAVDTSRERRPLALAVIDVALDGHYWPKARRDSATGRWPKSSAQMAFGLWAMAERVALRTYRSEHAEPLRLMQAAWRPEVAGLKECLRQPCDHRDAPAIVRRLTLPQLVCCVLPWWTLHELPRLRAAARDAARPAGRSHAAAARALQARDEYRKALARYQALVSFAADPWRIRNAHHARVGREVMLQAKWTGDGSLDSLTSVGTAYPGDGDGDIPEVTTKVGRSRGTWRWSPVIADARWLEEVLREHWLPGLVEAGVVPSGTSLEAAACAGRFAWFVNPSPRSSAPVIVEGAFRDDSSITERFGDALLAGLRAMGIGPLPTSAATAAAEGFALQFTPHTMRTLWATYWLGVRGATGPLRPGTTERHDGVQVACAATGDTEATLRGNYAVVESVVAEQLREPVRSWRHPRAFDDLMDRTWFHGTSVDWARQWRDPAFRALLPEPLQALQPGAPRRPRPRRMSRRGRGA